MKVIVNATPLIAGGGEGGRGGGGELCLLSQSG